MTNRLVRLSQTVAAGAVVFAILGGCGFAPPSRRGPVVIRPRPPGPEVTIRSLTGEWEAVQPTASGPRMIGLSLVQRGDTVRATLAIDGRTLSDDPSRPARLDARGQFVLVFGQSTEVIVVRGRPDASEDWIAATLTGLDSEPLPTVFQRRQR